MIVEIFGGLFYGLSMIIGGDGLCLLSVNEFVIVCF